MPGFLREMGLTPGREIAYADLDLDEVDPIYKGISGIVQNSTLLGKAAVDLVVSSLNRNQSGVPGVPFVLQVEGTWVKKRSTPPRRPARRGIT